MDTTRSHETVEITTFHEQMDRNAPTKNQNSADAQDLVEMIEGQIDRNAPTENQNSTDVQTLVQIPKGKMDINATT